MELKLPQTACLLWSGTSLYTVAFLFALISVLKKQPYLRKTFYSILGLGFILQSLGLYTRGLEHGAFPLTNPTEILQVIAWTAILLTIVIQSAFHLKLFAFFGSALASIVGLTSMSIPQWDVLNQQSAMISNPWIGFHVALAIFAYGTFGLLAITALMYLLQDYALANKRFGGFFSMLPSLRQMDELTQRLLLIGVVSLTIAVGVGTLIWFDHSEELSLGKMLSTWGLWIAYFSILVIKVKKICPPRLLAWVYILLFLMAILSLWPAQT